MLFLKSALVFQIMVFVVFILGVHPWFFSLDFFPVQIVFTLPWGPKPRMMYGVKRELSSCLTKKSIDAVNCHNCVVWHGFVVTFYENRKFLMLGSSCRS